MNLGPELIAIGYHFKDTFAIEVDPCSSQCRRSNCGIYLHLEKDIGFSGSMHQVRMGNIKTRDNPMMHWTDNKLPEIIADPRAIIKSP